MHTKKETLAICAGYKKKCRSIAGQLLLTYLFACVFIAALQMLPIFPEEPKCAKWNNGKLH